MPCKTGDPGRVPFRVWGLGFRVGLKSLGLGTESEVIDPKLRNSSTSRKGFEFIGRPAF